jgi:RNA recognition motif-containing protein
MFISDDNPQISRDPETGLSRGCGFVTMRSLPEARTAMNALDGFVSHTRALQFPLLTLYLSA